MKGPAVSMKSEAHALYSAVDYVVIPEERGMADLAGDLQLELRQDASPGIVKVPEEQVIRRMKHLRSKGQRTAGILMGASLEEERLRGNTENVIRLRDLELYDPGSIFGRPELCVLSRWGMNWSSLPNELRIGYQRRYEKLAREYISGLVQGGFRVEAIPLDECLGDHTELGPFDLAIGTLCRGMLLERTGMWPLDRIWSEGPVLIKMV